MTPLPRCSLRVAWVVAFLMGVSGPLVQAAPSPASTRQEELRQIRQRLDAQRRRLQQTRRRERALSGEIQRLDRARDATEARLARLAADLRRARQREEGAAAALARAEMALARRRSLLAGRLRDVHRYGRAGYLDVVLGAATFPEFVTRAHLVSAIVRADARLIEGYIDDRDRTAALREDLEREQRRLGALVRETDERRRQLVHQTVEKRRVLEGIVRERAAAERAVGELEEESAELEALIQRLQSGNAAVRGRSMSAFLWPLRGPMTSRFGFRRHPIFRLRQFHQGVDISAPRGTPVRAADDGTVIFAGWYGGYGKLVIIDHGQGMSTLSGHLSAILVRVGQSVVRGKVIGQVGSTGYSTGPHLHFEVRRNGRPINPAP
ncbi:MAG: peptidoglycan DD-metalloendopeptidase family protein [Armatimonadetes bacterium]|nr:peptidoglycan DD-metalloendopeptidase family protein [Armatimonadota bacterium]